VIAKGRDGQREDHFRFGTRLAIDFPVRVESIPLELSPRKKTSLRVDHERRRLQKLTATDKCVRRNGRTSLTDEKRMSGLSGVIKWNVSRGGMAPFVWPDIAATNPHFRRPEPRGRCWVSAIAATPPLQVFSTHRASLTSAFLHRILFTSLSLSLSLCLSLSLSERDIV